MPLKKPYEASMKDNMAACDDRLTLQPSKAESPRRPMAATSAGNDGSRSATPDGYGNRKHTRASQLQSAPGNVPLPEKPVAPGRDEATAPEQTGAESFYYLKQIQTRTLMLVTLENGEEIRGSIAWYDRDCIMLRRESGQGRLIIYKSSIKYLYKDPAQTSEA
jgi:sRNA-binding regulator protein Hfq